MSITRTPSLMDGIHDGIEAAGRALLDEARLTGRPLVTFRDGKVILVDADGHPVSELPGLKEMPQ